MLYVGLSNKLDSEGNRGMPIERPHRKVVEMAVINSKLFDKVTERVKGTAGIEAFLVLMVTALHFAVMPRCIGANPLMPDVHLSGSLLKKREGTFPAARKRLVNSKPLSVWTYSTRVPFLAYQFISLFRKSAEEYVDCSG